MSSSFRQTKHRSFLPTSKQMVWIPWYMYCTIPPNLRTSSAANDTFEYNCSKNWQKGSEFDCGWLSLSTTARLSPLNMNRACIFANPRQTISSALIAKDSVFGYFHINLFIFRLSHFQQRTATVLWPVVLLLRHYRTNIVEKQSVEILWNVRKSEGIKSLKPSLTMNKTQYLVV